MYLGNIIIDLEGKYGTTEHVYYIEVKDSEEAESIKKALRTNKFKDLLPALVLSNFQVSYKILSLLRKDFIEEF